MSVRRWSPYHSCLSEVKFTWTQHSWWGSLVASTAASPPPPASYWRQGRRSSRSAMPRQDLTGLRSTISLLVLPFRKIFIGTASAVNDFWGVGNLLGGALQEFYYVKAWHMLVICKTSFKWVEGERVLWSQKEFNLHDW